MVELCLGTRGEQSAMVRSMADHCIRKLQAKDYLGEIVAVRNFAGEKIRYSNDARGVEQVRDPQRICEDIVNYGNATADCDDAACFIACLCRQLGRECEFIVVGFGAPGIYSHVFTRVKEPKSGRWIVCDVVAGTDEGGMLKKVKTWKSVKVDL